MICTIFTDLYSLWHHKWVTQGGGGYEIMWGEKEWSPHWGWSCHETKRSSPCLFILFMNKYWQTKTNLYLIMNLFISNYTNNVFKIKSIFLNIEKFTFLKILLLRYHYFLMVLNPPKMASVTISPGKASVFQFCKCCLCRCWLTSCSVAGAINLSPT